MDFNKEYYGILSIGVYNADQRDIFKPSDFFTEDEWNDMDEDTQANNFAQECYEVMLSNYADFGLREKA